VVRRPHVSGDVRWENGTDINLEPGGGRKALQTGIRKTASEGKEKTINQSVHLERKTLVKGESRDVQEGSASKKKEHCCGGRKFLVSLSLSFHASGRHVRRGRISFKERRSI